MFYKSPTCSSLESGAANDSTGQYAFMTDVCYFVATDVKYSPPILMLHNNGTSEQYSHCHICVHLILPVSFTVNTPLNNGGNSLINVSELTA